MGDGNMINKYAVRKWAVSRPGENYEMYVVATGECASLPGSKRECEKYAKQCNLEAAQPAQVQA